MPSYWDRCFPNCEPIGHRLRVAFPERWVRFHSLSESKRYPEDEAEYTVLLARHNAILGEMADSCERVILVTTDCSDEPVLSRPDPAVEAFNPGASPWRTISMHRVEEGFDEPSYWHLFCLATEWRPGAFDPIFRLVADATVANLLVVASDCRWVLHPYDGGMDVITESPETRRVLREKYAGWLSGRADGL